MPGIHVGKRLRITSNAPKFVLRLHWTRSVVSFEYWRRMSIANSNTEDPWNSFAMMIDHVSLQAQRWFIVTSWFMRTQGAWLQLKSPAQMGHAPPSRALTILYTYPLKKKWKRRMVRIAASTRVHLYCIVWPWVCCSQRVFSVCELPTCSCTCASFTLSGYTCIHREMEVSYHNCRHKFEEGLRLWPLIYVNQHLV